MPQDPAHRRAAISTHSASHANEQQVMSSAQTVAQQLGSSQKGSAWSSRHGLLQPEPHPTGPQQCRRARLTHSWSQSFSQQVGLMLHTTVQHVLRSHPGLSCGLKQSPAHGHGHGSPDCCWHRWRAIWTQLVSHSPLQQMGSMMQVALQQDGSSQPGFWCAAKQSPSLGHEPGDTQMPAARVAHSWSHASVQHRGETLHTVRMHCADAQPGLSCASRQPSRPICVGNVAVQSSSAWYAQTESQRVSQQ
jgi:hypothetical protein